MDFADIIQPLDLKLDYSQVLQEQETIADQEQFDQPLINQRMQSEDKMEKIQDADWSDDD